MIPLELLYTRLLQSEDIDIISAAFMAIGWNKPASQYSRYLKEQTAGVRVVVLAFVDNIFSGYITVNWQSDYPPFHTEKIPEIQDFNVLPHFQRRGIGSRMMDEAEQIIAEHSRIVGIRVGLYADYGSAHRMYVRRGYIPDGRGLFFQGRFALPGESVIVNDDLTISFTKSL